MKREREGGRRPNSERETPHTDAWMARLRSFLSEHGSQTELAKWMAAGNEEAVQGQRVYLNKILSRKTLPSVEFYFVAEGWIATKEQSRPRKSGRAK